MKKIKVASSLVIGFLFLTLSLNSSYASGDIRQERAQENHSDSSVTQETSLLDHSRQEHAGVSDIKIEKSNMTRNSLIALAIFLALVYFLYINKSTALKLKLRNRILSMAGLLLILMLGVGGVGFISMNQVGHELNAIAQQDIPLTEKVTSIETEALEQSIILEKLLRTVHEKGIDSSKSKKEILKLENEINLLTKKIETHFAEAEGICQSVIEEENTKEDVVQEFNMLLSSLKFLDNQHKTFKTHAIELFSHINNGDMHYVEEQESKIENELLALDDTIVGTLHEIEMFTQKAALTAEAHEKAAIRLLIIMIIISLFVGLGLGIFISNAVMNKLGGEPEVVAYIAEKVAEGDLSISVSELGANVGAMKSINEMVHRLRDVVSNVIHSTDYITDASQQMSSTSQQLSQGASEQASSVEEVSSTMEEIAANIAQNTDNAQETEKISLDAEKGINNVAEKAQQANVANSNIANKISIINDIAFQTNILALNAAVEAARAGEHGKGFAVVAAEVRKLAERSKIAAEDIVKLAEESLSLSEGAGLQMQETMPNVAKTTRLVQEISAASLEQNNGAGQINSAVQQLNTVTQQNAAASEEMATSAEELASQSEQLKELVAFFNVGESVHYGNNGIQNTVIKGNNAPKKQVAPKIASPGSSGANILLKEDTASDSQFESF